MQLHSSAAYRLLPRAIVVLSAGVLFLAGAKQATAQQGCQPPPTTGGACTPGGAALDWRDGSLLDVQLSAIPTACTNIRTTGWGGGGYAYGSSPSGACNEASGGGGGFVDLQFQLTGAL